jgi:hypothetical protein
LAVTGSVSAGGDAATLALTTVLLLSTGCAIIALLIAGRERRERYWRWLRRTPPRNWAPFLGALALLFGNATLRDRGDYWHFLVRYSIVAFLATGLLISFGRYMRRKLSDEQWERLREGSLDDPFKDPRVRRGALWFLALLIVGLVVLANLLPDLFAVSD